MRAGLKELDIPSFVLAHTGVADASTVITGELPPPRKTFFGNLVSSVQWRISPEKKHLRMVADSILRAIDHLHRLHGIQVVEMEDSFGWAALVAARSPVPVFARIHGPWFLNGKANGAPEDASYHVRNAAERRVFAQVKGLIFQTNDMLTRVRKHFRLPLAHATVIPNPVRRTDPSDLWNLDASKPDEVLFVGRFDRHKGGDIVVQTMQRLLAARPNTTLRFVGPDPGLTDDSGRTWSLPDYINHVLGPNCGKVICTGALDAKAIAPLRQQARVTLFASRYDNFPATVLEAMSVGCPLVATNVGGIPEMIDNQHTGLVRECDPEALADALLSLLTNPERCSELGQAARKSSLVRFSPQGLARQTLHYYASMM